MSQETLTEEQKKFVEERIYGSGMSEDALRNNTRGFTSAMIEYAITRNESYANFKTEVAYLRALLPEVQRREEVQKSHALMEALRAELIAAQRKIEDGNHIRDEAARAAEAEAVAAKRHAENVRLTRCAIRWAALAAVIGILSVVATILPTCAANN